MTKPSTHRKRLDSNEARSSGFTLVELMITVALAAIILSAAVPSFRDLVQNNRITAQVNEFITALNVARSEAIKRGATVLVEALPGGGASNEFGLGWRVCVDTNGDGDCSATEALRESAALSGGATLDSFNNISELQYLSSGLLNITAGNRRFELRIPQCRGNQARDVTILPTGRATIASVACA